MDKHGKIVSPMRGGGISRSSSKKYDFLRSKNQSTLNHRQDDFDLIKHSMFSTQKDFNSQNKIKIDKSNGVDQIWTSESIVANAMASQSRQKNYSSQERPDAYVQPTFIKQLIEN